MKKKLIKTIFMFLIGVLVVSFQNKDIQRSVEEKHSNGIRRALKTSNRLLENSPKWLEQIIFYFQPCNPEDDFLPVKILAPDGAVLDEFGRSVGIFEENIIIGAHKDNDNGLDSGSVYLFSSDGSSQEKLTSFDGETGDGFGYSVAISSSIAVVGAYTDDDLTGSVYIFPLNDTSNQTQIRAPNGTANDRFGWSVAVSGDSIAVGGLFDVFLFNSQGEFVSELTVPDGDIMFGNSVAMSEEVVVVGAFRDDEDMGSVHSYTASGNYLAKLGPPDGISNGQFGYDVAIFRDTVVIGAPFEGSAYLYSVDGTLVKQLTNWDVDASDQFGRSVTVSEDIIVIGAHLNDNENGNDAGAVYVYKKNGEFIRKLIANDGEKGEYFGSDVSVVGDKLVVGASGDDDNGDNSGSAYIYLISSLTGS